MLCTGGEEIQRKIKMKSQKGAKTSLPQLEKAHPTSPTKTRITKPFSSYPNLREFSSLADPFSSVLPMAKNILGSSQNDKAVHVLGLFSFLLLIQKGGAYEFRVGGSSGWTVPTASNRINYNKWAEDNRFQIGDTLLFVYPANNDTMLYVNKDDYTNCNPDKPISTYADGHTVFKLDRSGLFYFISGTKENCLKHEKLVVAVLADRSNNSSKTNTTTVASPPPSASEITPSPAPAGEGSPPSPGGSIEIVPSAGPTTEQSPPHNGVSSTALTSFVGSIGAFLASSLLLAF